MPTFIAAPHVARPARRLRDLAARPTVAVTIDTETQPPQAYLDDYGIGPWQIYEFNAGSAEDYREYGQPVERSWPLPSPQSARCSGS